MTHHTHPHLRIIAHRLGTGAAVVAFREGREAYVGDARALRARLAQRLDELRSQLATHCSFDEPGAGGMAERIAAVALAIEELDALIREDNAAASG